MVKRIGIIESIAAIPLYDGDIEEGQGVPAPVSRLKDASDAVRESIAMFVKGFVDYVRGRG